MKSNVGFDYIIYGGAFDPPHIGHLNVLKVTASLFPDIEILVMPNQESPIKVKISCSFEHRIKMCELLVSEISSSNIFISNLERDLPTPNFTIHTLEALTKIKPKQKPAILLGDDNLKIFPKWKDYAAILNNAVLLIVPRTAKDQSQKNEIEKLINHKDDLTWEDHNELSILKINNEIKFIIIHSSKIEASSTEIRKNHKLDNKLLTTKVFEYIKTNNLYSIGATNEHT